MKLLNNTKKIYINKIFFNHPHIFHSVITLKLGNVIFCFMGSESENKSIYG
jgi:hypothetical protein